jgi:Flp pilus assembly protein protease CpaA
VSWPGPVSTTLLFAFTAITAVTDIWRRRIYNWTTYPGILAAFAANTLEAGLPGFEESVKGFLGLGLIMLVCIAAFPIGGGDVKLLAMLGAFLGFRAGLEALLWTFVLGSVMGLARVIWAVGIVRLLGRLGRRAWNLVRGQWWTPADEAERTLLDTRLFLAPAALAAVVIVKLSLFPTSAWP